MATTTSSQQNALDWLRRMFPDSGPGGIMPGADPSQRFIPIQYGTSGRGRAGPGNPIYTSLNLAQQQGPPGYVGNTGVHLPRPPMSTGDEFPPAPPRPPMSTGDEFPPPPVRGPPGYLGNTGVQIPQTSPVAVGAPLPRPLQAINAADTGRTFRSPYQTASGEPQYLTSGGGVSFADVVRWASRNLGTANPFVQAIRGIMKTTPLNAGEPDPSLPYINQGPMASPMVGRPQQPMTIGQDPGWQSRIPSGWVRFADGSYGPPNPAFPGGGQSMGGFPDLYGGGL